MLLKEFGFYVNFQVYSTAICIEGKGAATVKIQLAYVLLLD